MTCFLQLSSVCCPLFYLRPFHSIFRWCTHSFILLCMILWCPLYFTQQCIFWDIPLIFSIVSIVSNTRFVSVSARLFCNGSNNYFVNARFRLLLNMFVSPETWFGKWFNQSDLGNSHLVHEFWAMLCLSLSLSVRESAETRADEPRCERAQLRIRWFLDIIYRWNIRERSNKHSGRANFNTRACNPNFVILGNFSLQSRLFRRNNASLSCSSRIRNQLCTIIEKISKMHDDRYEPDLSAINDPEDSLRTERRDFR